MTYTTDTSLIEKAYAEAYEIGKRDGQNCAYWTLQGTFNNMKDHKAIAKHVIKMLDDGDPAFWEHANLPDLSGQHSDGLTPMGLYSQLCFEFKLITLDLETEDDYPIEDIWYETFCLNYEMGASDGYVEQIEKTCRDYLDNN
jgi:hypothetical protein